MNIYTPNLSNALLRLERSIAEAKKVMHPLMVVSPCNNNPTKSTLNLRDLNRELINNKQ